MPRGRRRGRRIPPSSLPAGVPTLVLSASSVSLSATAGDTATTQSVITARSGTGAPLGGVGIGTVTEDSGSGWLSATVQQGFPALVTIVCDPDGLSAATYTGSVQVTDPQASNSPRTVTVSFVVGAAQAAPTIVRSPSTVALSVQQGNAATATADVLITSGTAGVLAGPTVGTITGTGSTGVTAAITGNDPYTLTVTAASAALTSAGSPYSATVPILDADASNSPQNVTVTLTVTAVSPPPTPTILLSSSTLSLTAVEGSGVTRTGTITVSSGNGAALGTTTVGTITGTGASAVSTSVNGHVVTVSAAVGSLSAAVYTITIPILDSLASNSPQNVTLTFTVTASNVPTTNIPAAVNLLGSVAGQNILVAGGWPLPPGAMTAQDVTDRKFAIFVNAVEQSCYVEAMPGRHPDGSVRSLIYQFRYDIPNSTPISAEARIGTARTTTDLAKTSLTPTVLWVTQPSQTWGIDALPTAKLLATDTAYLCATDLTFQPLIPASQQTAAETARFTTLLEARANALRNNTVNRDQGANGSVDKFRSTYDVPRALLAHWCKTGNPQWYQDAMALCYRLTEYVFPGPTYSGYNPSPNVWGEARFTQTSNADWAEQYSQRLWSYAACWQASGYAPFYTRVNAAHQMQNSSVRATQAGAIQVSGDLGYISQPYGMRPNVFKATRHIVAYAIGANRRTSSPSGYGNRNMVFPTELPFIIDAWEARSWNRAGDWRNGVVGINYANTDGTANNAPHAEDFPTFQLSLANHMLIAYEREVYADARIPAMVKANVDALLLNTRALVAGDTGYPTAAWGAPYWMNRNGPASQGFGGAATCVYFGMDAAAIAYCAAKFPGVTVNGATYSTWYDRAVDAAANSTTVQSYEWGLWNVGWKIFGELFGNAQSGPYYRANGFPAGPSAINALTVPTGWPI